MHTVRPPDQFRLVCAARVSHHPLLTEQFTVSIIASWRVFPLLRPNGGEVIGGRKKQQRIPGIRLLSACSIFLTQAGNTANCGRFSETKPKPS